MFLQKKSSAFTSIKETSSQVLDLKTDKTHIKQQMYIQINTNTVKVSMKKHQMSKRGQMKYDHALQIYCAMTSWHLSALTRLWLHSQWHVSIYSSESGKINSLWEPWNLTHWETVT